jgi:hypothetical protein
MQVGCALLQAQYGALSNEKLAEFNTEGWLLYPSPTMGVYEVTEEQLKVLVHRVNTTHKKGK